MSSRDNHLWDYKPPLAFLWLLGIKFTSSCLCENHFTGWAISRNPRIWSPFSTKHLRSHKWHAFPFMNKTLISESREAWIQMWSCPALCPLDSFLTARPQVLGNLGGKDSLIWKLFFHIEFCPTPPERTNTYLREVKWPDRGDPVHPPRLLRQELLESPRYVQRYTGPIMYPSVHFIISNVDL